MKWTFYPAGDFAPHAARWDSLCATLPAAPMLDSGFVAALLDVFGSGAELLAFCEEGDELLAAAILVRHGRASWATFQPSQAPVGLWLQRPGVDVDRLLAALTPALPGFALLVGLTQCDPFLLPRPCDGNRQTTVDYIDTARISAIDDFDVWWSGHGKNLRSNLKKQRNRLAAAGITTTLEIWRRPEQMAQAIADYGRLESTGWKGREGTAVAADNEQGRFYQSMLESLCARGRGSVYRYRFGDDLMAMDLCIENGNCFVILKTAYDEHGTSGQYSPATLMREEACRHLFEEKRIQRIEFYGRVMEWHTRWTSEVRTMYHLNHYRWPVLGYLHARRRKA